MSLQFFSSASASRSFGYDDYDLPQNLFRTKETVRKQSHRFITLLIGELAIICHHHISRSPSIHSADCEDVGTAILNADFAGWWSDWSGWGESILIVGSSCVER